jgi:hypothetical protein
MSTLLIIFLLLTVTAILTAIAIWLISEQKAAFDINDEVLTVPEKVIPEVSKSYNMSTDIGKPKVVTQSRLVTFTTGSSHVHPASKKRLHNTIVSGDPEIFDPINVHLPLINTDEESSLRQHTIDHTPDMSIPTTNHFYDFSGGTSGGAGAGRSWDNTPSYDSHSSTSYDSGSSDSGSSND